jgi:hypothetical protein
MNKNEDWNPDTACEEMAALFVEADRIMQQPHYKEDASTADMDSPGADLLPKTEVNES